MSNMGSANTDSTGRSTVEIDEIGYGILAELRDNGRVSIAQLAQHMGISRSNAYARVEAMQRAGIITKYSAQIDPVRAGLGVCTLVFVTVYPQTWPAFLSEIVAMPDVESAKITTGEHDAMLLTRGADVESVHAFVIGVIAALPQVKSVETVLVLDEIIDRGRLLPTDLFDRTEVASEQGLLRYTPTSPDRPSKI